MASEKTEVDKENIEPVVEQEQSKPVDTEKERIDNDEKISSLFADGYKFFIAKDFVDAANKLSEAVELSVGSKGQYAKEGYQLHYYYGRALTEVARTDQVVMPSIEKQERDDAVDTTQDSESPEEKKPAALDQGNESSDVKVKSDLSKTDDKETVAAEESNVDMTLRTDDEEEDLDEDDEPNDIKLAWEILEVARKICEQQEQTEEWQKNKADVYVALGECKVVDESFDKALVEFNNALDIQKDIYEPHDRRIAETMFHLGIAHSNFDDFDKATEWFQKSGEVIQKTIDFELAKENAASDQASVALIDELKKILEDIKEKVEDTRASAAYRQTQLDEGKNTVRSMFNEMAAFVPNQAGDSGDVNDISNMVRKSVKRPNGSGIPSTETNTAEGTAIAEQKSAEPSDKKPKLDESQN